MSELLKLALKNANSSSKYNMNNALLTGLEDNIT